MILLYALPSTTLDRLVFGQPASEAAHALVSDRSDVVAGGLDTPARRLLPPAASGWEGGRVAFTLKVDPVRQNYLTARLWGGEASDDRLVLLCDGKQIGYRHLGEIDLLDAGTPEPSYPGRFYYVTNPLPLALTKGKTTLPFEIRSNGPIWGYGNTWEQYQKPMTLPSRGVYGVYTHVAEMYVPDPSERQGIAPKAPPARSEPGPEVLDALKARVSKSIVGILEARRPPNQMEMQFLGRAYGVAWTPAFGNPKVVERVAEGLDAFYLAQKRDPEAMRADPATWNPGWFGAGPAGEAVWALAKPLATLLDRPLDGRTRRVAWAEMLRASVDWNVRRRKQYTNQSMIVDLNVALANRGLATLMPERALPTATTLRYLEESMGLEPWLGSETGAGPSYELGKTYRQLTKRSLTRELGFTGYYGEVLDWATQILDATRALPGSPGDPRIRAQLVRMAQARAVFRAPMVDAQGNRAMRAETLVGWRDEGHYPGDITYAQRPSWDGNPVQATAATLDPQMLGAVRQMIADGQLYPSLAGQMAENGGLRVTISLLGVPDDLARIAAARPSSLRLPMSPESPDFVWADPEDGVVAIKNGRDTLYASLYWRARNGINNLARVHLTRPESDHIAVVHQDEAFEPSGMTYVKPDWTNFDFGNGGLRYPDGVHSAHAGTVYPIAKIPEGVPFHPGDESPYAGRAQLYVLRYGPYMIAMNATTDKSFPIDLPPAKGAVRELVSGRKIPSRGGRQAVGPGETAVFYTAS